MSRNRRNKRNSGFRIFDYIDKKVFLIIVIVLVSIIISLLYTSLKNSNEMEELAKQTEALKNEFQKVYSKTEEENKNTKEEEEEKLELTIVGNIFCTTDHILNSYSMENKRYEFSNIFKNVKGIIGESDITIGTISTNFNRKDFTSGKKNNAPPEFANDLRTLGIDVLNIATEHANDYGKEGMQETSNYLNNQGIKVIGNKIDNNDNICIYDYKAFKVAILSYAQNKFVNDGKENLAIYETEKAKKEIEYAKEKADIVVVLMQWAELNQSNASTREINMADELVGLGADIVIGNHSNYVQQMEMKKSIGGKNALVAYSLGNYLSTTIDDNTKVDLVLKITLAKSKEDGKVYIKKVNYIPIYEIDYGEKTKQRYQYVDLRKTVEEYKDVRKGEKERTIYNQMTRALEWVDKVIVGG